jgi:serine/threonine protein kinase
MKTVLMVTTLGELRFQLGNEIASGFTSRKVEALLVYLAVEKNSVHRRERLFTLLWPGKPESSARNNLRVVLSSLRQAIPEVASIQGEDEFVQLLMANRQTAQINPAAAVEVDIHQIDRLLDAVDVHDHLNLAGCEACVESLQKVVALYRGNFLADFYLEDSTEFEDWAEANREAYRGKVLNTLGRLAEIFIQKGAYDQASKYAFEQVKIDPLREIAYRQLMALYSKSGRRTEALRTYQRCEKILDIELGITPSRETTALYEIISGEDLRETQATPREGMIRGYQIREHLGSGHTGMVYRAFQPVINRDVAVKVIAPQFANHPDFIRRFEVEAQLVARLEHPYIVPLYDYWRDPSGAYLVMRWLKGGSLQDYLKNGPWMPDAAVGLMDQISAALSFAHRQGVVHCDIKPANILLDEENSAYLSDFGIAILTGPLAQLTQYRDLGQDGSSSGSLGYISPEVARGRETTPLADVYSLGVVLFELLTARHPFPGLEGDALIQKHLTEPLPSVQALRAELPAGVDEVIQKATEKEPGQRYPDVNQLAQAFRAVVDPETITVAEETELRNPYKGLRSFEEADSGDFFGRDQLVGRLLERLSPTDDVTPGERFVAVVGPSGSGKSSVVKAGLIPAVRRGEIPGSKDWFIVEMTPGARPLEELESALLQIAIETPEDFLSQLKSGGSSLLRVLRKALPGVKNDVLLVIDQFEELFTLVEGEAERKHFLDMLVTAVSDPHSTLRLVVTLRADFYDRSGFLRPPIGTWRIW